MIGKRGFWPYRARITRYRDRFGCWVWVWIVLILILVAAVWNYLLKDWLF